MTFDLVIFDCDGVLVDSEPTANRVLAEQLATVGLRLSVEETVARYAGRSLEDCGRLIEEETGRPLPEGFFEELQRRTFEAFRLELLPVAGVLSALDRIEVPTCVASSGDLAKMRTTLGLTGLMLRFEGRMFSTSQVERGKPHPDLFLMAAREMGASPDRCAVVEDSPLGIEAALAAGMKPFGYAGTFARASLEKPGVVVFDSMLDLPDLLARA